MVTPSVSFGVSVLGDGLFFFFFFSHYNDFEEKMEINGKGKKKKKKHLKITQRSHLYSPQLHSEAFDRCPGQNC